MAGRSCAVKELGNKPGTKNFVVMRKQSDLLAGLSREQYVSEQVSLEGFPVLEDNWQQLLQWMVRMSENLCFYNFQFEKSGNWREFWNNQLMVILTDLVLFDTDTYRKQFVAAKGTGRERAMLKELEDFVKSVVTRLQRCEYNLILNRQMGKERTGVLEEITTGLKRRLEQAVDWEKGSGTFCLKEEPTINSLSFFRILDAVGDIRLHSEYYMGRIVNCGEIEPALAVLYIFLRNYTGRVSDFNRRLGQLPVFYIRKVLKSSPQQALPDHTWIVLNKAAEVDSVIVPMGTAFVGGVKEDGSDLRYLTIEQIVITDMLLDAVYAVLLTTTSLCRREIPLLAGETATDLFMDEGGEGKDIPVGWMIVSPMFDLREGTRDIELHLALTVGPGVFLNDLAGRLKYQPSEAEHVLKDAFVVKVSNGEGWLAADTCTTSLEQEQTVLVVHFALKEEVPPLTVCTEDIHGIVTDSPAIQLLLNGNANLFPYSWASCIAFKRLTVKVKVQGISTIKLYSEYGELDSSVPFYPFGVQAKKGAWFVFGNYEMARKPLTSVALSYRWQQLPSGERGFAEHYADYKLQHPINNLSFEVWTEWLKDRRWVSQLGTSFLFEGSEAFSEVKENGSITFWMEKEMPVLDVTEENYVLSKARNGFWRVTLSAPEIGFGSELYRQLLTQVMINNSRKPKDTEPLPAEPIVPMMSDMELAYEAEDTFLPDEAGWRADFSLYQLKALAWKPYLPVGRQFSFALADPLQRHAHLLFAFRNALGSGLVRIYFDIAMRQDEIGFAGDKLNQMKVDWYYNDGFDWQLLPSEQVLQENTHVFTHAGLVELALPEPVAAEWLDQQGRFWIRASVGGEYKECRLVRGFYTNAVEVVADGGDGSSLPCGTITQSAESVPGIESVNQIVSGFGGCPPEDERSMSLRVAHRIAHRGRAVSPVDFERMALEKFPVLEKVCCIPMTEKLKGQQAGNDPVNVLLVVMSREQGGQYPLCSLVTLKEIQKRLSMGISPFVRLVVTNPVYEKVRIHCRVRLLSVASVGAALRKLQNKMNYYIAPWLYRNEMPELNAGISLQGLYTVLANEEEGTDLKSLKLERVDEEDEDRKFVEFNLPSAEEKEEGKESLKKRLVGNVLVRESVCGGVFIPDENHVIEYEREK